MKKIFKNGVIITANEQNDLFSKGHFIIEDGLFTTVKEGEPEEQHCDEIIDLDGNWVMPGWINTHNHTAMSLLRGYADDLPLREWLQEKMWPMEGQFTKESVKWGSGLSIIEMLKSGTTCFLDMYDHMDTVAEQVEASGMRAVLCRGVIGLCSEEEQKQKLDEAVAFARNWNGQAQGRISTMMSPHAPYTCPPGYINRIVYQASKYDLPIHIHMSETAREVKQNVKDYGRRPVEHLRDIGVFERPTLVAHAVHLEDEEIEILKTHDVKISHNPISNLKLGSGIARLPALLEKGFHVAIGTDSSASNNNLDMFQEVRMAALIHKGACNDPTVVPAEIALKMGTRWGAEALFIKQLGSLEAGFKADFIVLDSSAPHLQPKAHPLSHIIYAATGADVKDVYVQGNAIVKERSCLTLDEEKIVFEANKAYQDLDKH
jgi:5-methylthioadenosine/S-adenosylhomocysteine deaminase